MEYSRRILYGVLNWGLGHATRSIPVIKALLKDGFEVIIATDGTPLELLKKEFPKCGFLHLPSLEIAYSNTSSQVFALGKQAGTFQKWFKAERKQIETHLKHHAYSGIISDNRPAVFSSKMPSVYLTHQLQVKAGFFTPMATFGHQQLFKHFTEIWVPDFLNREKRMAGKLSEPKQLKKIQFIGALSDLTKTPTEKKSGIAVLLSGPEPQRTLLENLVVDELCETKLNVILIRGSHRPAEKEIPANWTVIDVASRLQIQEAYNNCEVLVSRCGYSTLMDLYTFPKPAILIPTPGQPEQEYLAKLPIHQSNFVIQQQEGFAILANLEKAKQAIKNIHQVNEETDWAKLFCLFEGKGESRANP